MLQRRKVQWVSRTTRKASGMPPAKKVIAKIGKTSGKHTTAPANAEQGRIDELIGKAEKRFGHGAIEQLLAPDFSRSSGEAYHALYVLTNALGCTDEDVEALKRRWEELKQRKKK